MASFSRGIPSHVLDHGDLETGSELRAVVAGSKLEGFLNRRSHWNPSERQIANWGHREVLEELCGETMTVVIGTEFRSVPLGLLEGPASSK